MRIGIYVGGGLPDPKTGGGFTFQDSLLNEIKHYKTHHEFYIFYEGKHFSDNSHIQYVSLYNYLEKNSRNLFGKISSKVASIIGFAQKSVKNNFEIALRNAVIKNSIDLMWFMTPTNRRVDVPFIYTVWDLQHRKQSFFPEVSVTGSNFEDRERQYCSLLPRAAYVIAGNSVGKNEVVQFYGLPEERVKMLELPTPNFVFQDFSTINVEEKFGIKRPYLFYPAQFWPHKNHVVILRALKILKEKYNQDFSLVLTGSDKGNLEYIKQQVVELELEQNVNFLGFVSIEELVSLYKNAFALTFTSFFGPDNIPPLEAMALRCPVITADVAGAREQLKDSVLYFDPKSEVELAAKIVTLVNDTKRSNTLIEKGVKHASSWTSKEYVDNIFKIIDEFEPIRRCWSSKEQYTHP